MNYRSFALTLTALALPSTALAADEVDDKDAIDRVSATTEPTDTRESEQKYASPQWFALELRFGPYRPEVDGDPKLRGQTPYEGSFGPNPRLIFGAELDVQPLKLKKWGTLGAGFQFTYADISRPTKRLDNGQAAAGETTLTVFPMSLVAVLRVDALRDQAKIPVSPYVKAGLSYALWRASDLGGTSQVTTTAGTTVEGKGATWGTHFAGGLAFDIGALDRRAAHNIDETMGINHTYIFAEWMLLGLTGLGSTNALHLDASTWVLGMSAEF